MNSKDNSIKIVCYGDSNTWGYIPATGERHPASIRWTGLLQKSLGYDFEIVEEGVSSRTTTFDDPKHEGKNGKTYLIPCLETHNPIDILILFLGTNDLKERFNKTPEQIFKSVEELVITIKEYAWNKNKKQPKFILVSPTIVDETVDGVEEKYKGAEKKSQQFPDGYRKIAEKYGLVFVNLQEFVKPSKKDGYHLDPESHKTISNKFEIVIKNLEKTPVVPPFVQ